MADDLDVPPLLEAVGISRRKPASDSWLLHDVSLALHAGDRVAIVGPSGSGKTLLLRALALLDPLDRGSVRWHSEAVVQDRVPAYRSKAIYVQQRPALIEDSVLANLRQPFAFRCHRGSVFDEARVCGDLHSLERDASFLQKSSRDLSGGEMQITALLRALQLDPQVLLLDEPTSALDPRSIESVERLVMRWFDARPGERAWIWISHDRNQAARISQQQYAMQQGRLQRAHDR